MYAGRLWRSRYSDRLRWGGTPRDKPEYVRLNARVRLELKMKLVAVALFLSVAPVQAVAPVLAVVSTAVRVEVSAVVRVEALTAVRGEVVLEVGSACGTYARRGGGCNVESGIWYVCKTALARPMDAPLAFGWREGS